jgi:hypothetical protein
MKKKLSLSAFFVTLSLFASDSDIGNLQKIMAKVSLKKSSSLGCISEDGNQSDERALKRCPLSGSHLPSKEQLSIESTSYIPAYLVKHTTVSDLSRATEEREK